VPFLGQKRLEGRSGSLASLSFFSLRARSWHSYTSFLLDQVDHAGNNTASCASVRECPPSTGGELAQRTEQLGLNRLVERDLDNFAEGHFLTLDNDCCAE
jgi:hypothetical protein